jgi:hypothetical protein
MCGIITLYVCGGREWNGLLSLDQVKTYLKVGHWRYEEHDEHIVVSTVGETTRVRVNIDVYPEGKSLSIYCFFDLDSQCVRENRNAILEILNETNFRTRYCKCFLEYGDLIQIQTLIPTSDTKVGYNNFFECLRCVVETANDLYPK